MAIPKCLEHLKRWGEYPVPFTVEWINGKPDFRVVDPDRVFRCHSEKLCGVCGRSLGELSWFIGGTACVEYHCFIDPPMHEECARFSATTYPFLSTHGTYSERKHDERVERIKVHSAETKTDESWLLVAETKKTLSVMIDGQLLFKAGRWKNQELINRFVPEKRAS